MRGYESIQTLSLIPRSDLQVAERVWTCHFPGDLRQSLAALKPARMALSRPGVLPVRSLNAAAAALLPGVMAIESGVGSPDFDGPWLHADIRPNADVLAMLLASWIRTEFEGDSAAKLASSINRADVVWEAADFNVGSWQAGENGTAEPAADNQFPYLGHFLAAQLSKPSVTFRLAGSVRTWRRAMSPWDRHAAELVSWPPFEFERFGRRWLFSIGLGLALQTVPWLAVPRVFADISLKRWMTAPIGKCDRRAATVLLSPRLSGVRLAGARREFQPAKIERTWDRRSRSYQWTWAGGLPELLTDFAQAWGEPIPDARELVKDPSRWLPGRADPAALIRYREGIRPKHPAGPGWGPIERMNMFERIVSEHLARWVDVAPPCRRVRTPVQKRTTESQITSAMWSVAAQAGPRLELLLWKQTDRSEETLREVGADLLGVAARSNSKSGWTWKRDSVEIIVNVVPLDPSIASGLDRPGLEDYAKRVSRRVSEVKAALSGGPTFRGCIVELGNRVEYGNQSRDPKFAIRRGAALAGYLTQFITPCDSGSPESVRRRMRSGLLDLFRQMGSARERGIEESGPKVLGLWVIRRSGATSFDRRRIGVPIAVRMGGEAGPELRGPGFNAWMPYGIGLLRLVRELDPFAGHSITATDCQEFFGRLIEEVVKSDEPTIMLTSAQNLRAHWPSISNKLLKLDELACGSRAWMAGDGNRLRHVRIRTSEGAETPEWYGAGAGGHPSGLWAVPASDRVFYSAQRRAASAQYQLAVSKIAQWEAKGMTRQPRPGARPGNPQLVEITVAMIQSGDDPLDLAGTVHSLRQAAVHFKDALILPLPLHLCELAREYVLADSAIDVGDDGADA